MDERAKTDWFAVAVLFFGGLVSAMQFAKVSPVMGDIAAEFGFGPVAAGFAVSILGLVGLTFAISAGALVSAAGLKRGLIGALFSGALLAALGALAPSGPLFLAARLGEGFSHLVIVVCSPALMALHARSADRPVVLSIWGCFFGVGFGITSSAAPFIVGAGGWRALLMTHAALMALAAMLAIVALRRSGHADTRAPLRGFSTFIAAHRDVYTSGAPILLAITFCAYTIQFLAVLTFLVPYLTGLRGWSEADAGGFIGAVTTVNLAATLAAGLLVRWGVTPRAGLAFSFGLAVLAALVLFIVQPGDAAAVACIIALMAAYGLMPGFVFAHVPHVAPTMALAALTYGAIAQFGNLGTFAGTPLFAMLHAGFGWMGGFSFVAATCAAGLISTLLLTRALPAGARA